MCETFDYIDGRVNENNVVHPAHFFFPFKTMDEVMFLWRRVDGSDKLLSANEMI